MKRAVLYCRASLADQHTETLDEESAAKKTAARPCDPMQQAFNQIWERVLRLGIEYGYRAAQHTEPLPEAIERALRATEEKK